MDDLIAHLQNRPFEVPDLPEPGPTADELLTERKKHYARKTAAAAARRLIPVTIKVDGPFGIAHFGDPDLPWQRVVNRFGGLASGYPGGRDGHAEHLLQEGITSTNHIVDNFEELRWRPDPTKLRL